MSTCHIHLAIFGQNRYIKNNPCYAMQCNTPYKPMVTWVGSMVSNCGVNIQVTDFHIGHYGSHFATFELVALYFSQLAKLATIEIVLSVHCQETFPRLFF